LSRRQKILIGVVYIDLDGFKAINDRMGHSAGDELLIAVSGRLRECVRDIDTVARIGGDEFCAVLVDIRGVEECEHLLNRMLSACSTPVVLSGKTCEVSASVGATLFPEDGESAGDLLIHADQAMYAAKQQGKNRYRFFNSLGT
jgi:diguanylate cyclase (GGDEF)-like protein